MNTNMDNTGKEKSKDFNVSPIPPPNLLSHDEEVSKGRGLFRGIILLFLFALAAASVVVVDFPVVGTGVVVPSKLLPVEAFEEGIIGDVHFSGGEKVEKGEVIAVLKNDDIVRDLEETKLKLDIVRKKLLQLDRSRNYLRVLTGTYEKLYQDEIIARSELEKAKLDYAHALQEYSIYQDEMQALRSKVSYYQSAFQNMKITAPISGIILDELQNKLGTFVRKGDLICQIGQMEDYLLELPIEEKHIQVFNVGAKASVHFPSFPYKTIDGEVVKVEHAVFEKVEKVLVTQNVINVLIEPKERTLPVKVGMTARIKIHSGGIRFRWARRTATTEAVVDQENVKAKDEAKLTAP